MSIFSMSGPLCKKLFSIWASNIYIYGKWMC